MQSYCRIIDCIPYVVVCYLSVTYLFFNWNFIPGGSDDKQYSCNVGDLGSSLGQEDPLEKEWQPTLVFLPGKSHGQRSLVGYSLWGHKESDTTE